jgi:hypothetical protein
LQKLESDLFGSTPLNLLLGQTLLPYPSIEFPGRPSAARAEAVLAESLSSESA